VVDVQAPAEVEAVVETPEAPAAEATPEATPEAVAEQQ
jgi:hypothetical protein